MIIPFDGENKEWGLPYHGLWSGGSLALPNGTFKTYPSPHATTNPVADGYGTAWLSKRPGWAAPSRSTAEAADDAANGRQWLNYLLRSGNQGAIGGVSLGLQSALYVDGNGRSWLIGLSALQSPRAPDNPDPLGDRTTWTFTIKRFGYFDGQTHSTATKSVTTPSGISLGPSTSYGPGDGGLVVMAVKSDGSQAIMGRPIGTFGGSFSGQFWPQCIWQIDISGNGDETQTDFGLTFAITNIQNGDLVTLGSSTETRNGTQSIVTTTFGGTSSAPTVPSVSMTTTGHETYNLVAVGSRAEKLWCAYDGNDNLQWLEQFVETNWAANSEEFYTAGSTGYWNSLSDNGPYSYTRTVQGHPVGDGSGISGPSISGTTTYGYRFGGATLWSRTFDESTSRVSINFNSSGSISNPSSAGWNSALTPVTSSIQVVDPVTGHFVSSYSYTNVSSSGAQPPVSRYGWYEDTGSPPAGILVCPVRYGYQLIGLLRLPSASKGDGPYSIGTLVDAWAPDGGHVSFSVASPANYGQNAISSGGGVSGYFGTWHPVTGEIQMGSSPRCWV